ncbi:MAG: branched-chain amino acid ABC transporter permease [Candidatus Bipolaricaulota bacterium]|nr:branched-chain amino acid ABC transporter permease [Candidatus Bipolaricaulota bacterium]MDW8141295.1 branched-chain amino acid ABC transporter permease [Candidatus Bipolaricaulota bacterium]
MSQIMALSMMITALAGLAVLLTRRRAVERWGTVGATVALWAVLLGIAGAVGVEPTRMVSYLVNFVILASLYALLTLGLNVQWGYTGLFNIGIAGFFGLGAYVSTILVQNPKNLEVAPGLAGFFATYYNLPFPVGLLGAMLASGLLALIVGFATLRLRTDYLAIATIGISEILRIIVTNERTLTEGTRGIPNIPQPLYQCLVRQVVPKPPCELWGIQIPQFIEPAYYNWFYIFIVIGVLALGLVLIEIIARSPWGRVLRAVREDEDATNALGKNVFAFKLQSLIVGSVMMGAAGSLWAHFVKFVDPQIFDPVSGTFLVWVMLIVGGTGNNRGAILGAFIMWGIWTATNFLNDVLPPILDTPLGKINVAAQLFGPIRIIAIAIMLELILLFRPRGLLGEEKTTSAFAVEKK